MSRPPEKRLSLPARLLGSGARGAERVAGATGLDDAVELAVERAVQRALESPAVERALNDAVDSEMIDRVWARLLDSDEVQQLIERIAEAPEIRQAIRSQGAGFVGDLGREAGKVTRRLDDVAERVVRRALFRKRRTEPTEAVGAVTRIAAFALDIALLNGAVFVFASALALLISAIFGSFNDISAPGLIAGSVVWVGLAAAYFVVFWALAAQTPGMRFLSVRLVPADADGRGTGLRRAIRRLVGFVLALIPLGLGFLGILTKDNRRGWQDRRGQTEMVYVTRGELWKPDR